MAGRYFEIPFAATGDRTVTPNAVQPDGSMSYSEGYGFDYERANTDPAYKPVPRDGMNGLFYDVTEALGIIQKQGFADWTTDAQPYPVNATVRHNDVNWYSTIATNNDEPGVGPGATSCKSITDVVQLIDTLRIDVAAASTVDLTTLAPNTRHIRLTGAATINNFTIQAGQFYFVTVGAAQTIVNSASIVTQYGANINAVAGDTYCIGATAANVVYVWGYVKNIAEFPFTKVYESGELTFAAGLPVGPLSHGLGGYPKFITYEYRCIVADAGYAVGDRVFVNQPTGQSASDGLAMVGTATQLDGRWGSTRIGAFLSKASGSITNLTSTSWRVVVKAYI